MEAGTQPDTPIVKKPFASSTFMRVVKYTGVRLVVLFVTVVVAIYLTILIANMGGYVDTMMRAEIEYNVTQLVVNNPNSRNMSAEQKATLIAGMISSQVKLRGLDQPLAVRNARYLTNALTLNLGHAIQMVSDTGSRTVRLILLERLPATLLLMGTSQLLLFFSSLFLALSLSRQYGSWWDKFVIAMTPSSSAPGWFIGIFMILIFAAVFKILPFGGLVSSPPPSNPVLFAPAGIFAVLQRFFPQHLRLADVFPDLFQRRLRGDGQSQRPDFTRHRTSLYFAPDPAKHHHQLCPDPDRRLGRCDRYRAHL
jgi:ABC-type dipeptide/oligopeptide/nickel transport system permease component